MARVSFTDLMIFTNQFAAMLRSQLPLLDVMDNLAKETPHRYFSEILQDICDDVRHGVELSDAFKVYDHVFDRIYINIIRSGMMSGKLADALTQLASYMTKAEETRGKLKSAMSYPIFLLVAFFAVFNGMIFFVLPRFQKIFANFGGGLPAPTQILVNMGDFWRNYWLFIIGGIATAVVLIGIWLSTREGRLLWDEVKLKMPVMGRLWRMAALARMVRTLAVQFHNEVNILEALELAGSSCGNVYIEDVMYDIADSVERGSGIAQAFREYEIFSGIVLQMVASGEQTGKLDELLLSAAEYFEKLLDNEIETWTSLLNPMMTALIGGAIAGMMVAVFMPVFEMGKTMKH